jgi:hypothetical protein
MHSSASAEGLYKETAFTGFMDILSGVSNKFKFSLFNYLKLCPLLICEGRYELTAKVF